MVENRGLDVADDVTMVTIGDWNRLVLLLYYNEEDAQFSSTNVNAITSCLIGFEDGLGLYF